MELKNRSFLKLLDYTPAEIGQLLELAAAPAAAAAKRGRALQILGSDRVGNAVGGQNTADVGLALHVHRGDEFLAVEDRQHNTAPFI